MTVILQYTTGHEDLRLLMGDIALSEAFVGRGDTDCIFEMRAILPSHLPEIFQLTLSPTLLRGTIFLMSFSIVGVNTILGLKHILTSF